MGNKTSNRYRVYVFLILAVAVATIVLAINASSWLGKGANWGIVSMLIAGLLILATFYEFETRQVNAKEIALISMMGTLSAVARVPFAPIPNVQPSTFIIICTGYVFGPLAGFMTGALTAIISNVFLGHGPWTLFQILGWGLSGAIPGILPRTKAYVWILAIFGLVWGYCYGAILNVWAWASLIYPLTWKTFLLTMANSVWFDTMHAAANVIFMLLLGKRFVAILERWNKRFFWQAEP